MPPFRREGDHGGYGQPGSFATWRAFRAELGCAINPLTPRPRSGRIADADAVDTRINALRERSGRWE